MACPIAFFGWARYLAPKAKVTRSNRVGCASFFLFYSAICALGLKLQICLVRVSKQNPKKNRNGMQITWQLTMSVRPTFADGGHLKLRACSEAKHHDNPGAQVSHSIPHLHVWSQLIPERK